MSARHGASHSPETRYRLSLASKAAWADPAKRHRMHAAIRAGRLVRFTAEMDATIRAMRADGHSFDRIADRVGVCPETLKRRMRELGMLP